MSPVVVSRGVLCVHCNCQQSRSLVGIQSSAPERLCSFFVAVICKWVWLPAAQQQQLPSTPITSSGQEAQILDRDGQRLGWETAHSETLPLAFGFSVRK